MSFDKRYQNRKDKRKPYRRSKAFDRSCRPHGSCGHCQENRAYSTELRKAQAGEPTDMEK